MPQNKPIPFEEAFGQAEKGPSLSSSNPSVTKRTPIDMSRPLSFEEVFGVEAQEEQIDPLRNIYNSAVKTLTSDPVANYQALFGQFEAARRTRELADLKYPTSGGVSGMFGQVAGGTPQSIPAMFTPLAIPALLNFGLQAAGQARMQMWEKEQETGEEIGLLKKGAVILGYGAATVAMERLGFKKLRGVVDGLGAKALGEIGEATLTGSTKEVAKAIGRNVGSAAISMGLWEGGEEAMEQAAQNALDKLYMDRSLLEGVPQAFAAGTLGGLMLAPVGVAKAHFMVKEQLGQQAEAILAAARAKEEAGLEGTTYEEPGSLFQTTQGQPSKTIQEYKAAERRQVYKFAEEMYGTPFKSLNEDQQNNALAAWEAKKARESEIPPATAIGPEGFSLGPQREEGDLQELKVDDPRRIYKLPNEEPAPPELYYQQSDGSLSVIPLTEETKERIRARAMASGLIAGIVFEEKDSFETPSGGRAYGYFNPRTRTIHLARNVLPNTAGHEMFEAAWDFLADRGDPVIEQALAQWGGKERLADVAGNYYAGWNEDAPLMQRFARWLRGFWASIKSRLGGEISEEEFGAWVNRRMEQIGQYTRGMHQAMSGMAQYQSAEAANARAKERLLAWSGDNKLVDEQGLPLQVFHYTGTHRKGDSRIEVFDTPTWFSQKRNYAKESLEADISNEKAIYQTYIRMRNPLDLRVVGDIVVSDTLPVKRLLHNAGIDIFELGMAEEDFKYLAKFDNPRLVRAVRKAGYDGMIFHEAEANQDTYLVFNPNQVKSVENVGAFTEGPNLYYQSAEAARAHEIFRQQREALKKEQSFFKDFWKNRKRELVDQSGNIRVALEKLGPIGHRAMVYHDLVQGTTAAAANKMADYEPLIWGGLSQSEEQTLNEIAQARRYITLYDKYPDRYETSKEEADAMRAYLAELPQATKDKLYPRVERLFGAFRQVLDEGLAEQLITQEAHDRMAAVGPYLPRKHLDYIDPVTYSIRGEKMSVRDSGFYYTKELDDSFVQNDTRLLLYETISRLSARAVKNRANRELLKIATENPDNLLVKPAKLNEKTGRVEGITPKGYVPVGMFVDGKDVLVYMQEDMAKEWIVRDPQMKAQLARTIGWVTGVTPLKAMATGMNPAFALANFPRDLAHVFLTTNEYSQMMPTALGQMASDLAATAADAWSKKGSYKEFLAEGGGMSFLTHQGQHKLKTNAGFLERQLHDMQNLMGFLGEFTEVWTRLALRRRAIRNGKDSIEATWIARNYLDFSQGGSYSKVADQFIPYLNAGIQGTRGLLRAAKNDPGKFAWKATQLGLLSASLAYANALINPEIWDEIPDEEKARYFIIPRPELSFTDNEGNKRHMYMRIAKDQGQQSIAALFESMAMMAQGRPFNRDQVVEAVKAILPVVPDGTIIPPFADALLGYVFNKDFFRNEDIWKGEPLSKKSLEVTRGTNPAYVKLTELPVIGEDISPERLRYAVNQVFVSGNPFSWLVGGAFKQMLKETGLQPRELTQQEITTQIPGVNRILKTTTPGLRYKKEIQAMREEENTRMLEMRRGLDDAVERDIIEDSTESRRALRAYIKEQGRENRARLEERELWTRRLFNQPNRAWWMSVSTLPPELRAAAFYARWKQESPEVQEELEEQSRIIPGVLSPRFRRELRALQRSGQ